MGSTPARSSLGDFIRQRYREVLPRWLAAVRECAPARHLSDPALADHLPVVLNRIADTADRIAAGDWSSIPSDATIDHAMARLGGGLDLRDVVTEFFLLRQVLLEEVLGNPESPDLAGEVQLLCWAVDASIRESVSAFTAAKQRKLAALDRISSEALRARNLDELLPRLLQVVMETAAGVDIACLFLKEGDRLVHRAAVGLDATSHGQVCIQIGEGLAGKVAAERRPMAAVPDERDESEEGALLRARAIKALYAAPLLAEDRLLGVVQMGSASLERFSDEDLALLREVAERAAAALYQAELRDETERVAAELEKALAQRQVALDAARLGWWRYSPRRGVLNTDRRTAEILGVEGSEHSREDMLRLLHPEDAGRVGDDLRAAVDPARRPPYTIQYRIRRPDGAVRWVEAHGLATFEGEGPSGRPEHLVGALADITDRKRIEDALREEDRRKNEFLGVLSHELRNHLSPIRNGLYILEHSAPGSERAHGAHSIVDRQLGHLTRLVDDLLDVTRVGRGKIRLVRRRIDLVDVVRRTVEDQRGVVQDRELGVALPEAPLWSNADPTRLEQVVSNLLQNAAKFTPEHGRVTVSLRRAQGEAVLEVADSGVGMDQQTLATLFQPFRQAERTVGSSTGGLGLGLSLVKGLVELHGGTVTAHSEGPGQGSRFTVRLPLAAGDDDAPADVLARAGRRDAGE